VQEIADENKTTTARGSMVLPMLFVIAFALIGFPLLGWVVVLLVGTAMSLALLAYRLTTYKSPRGPSLLPYYLLTAAGLHLHVLEEHLMGFPAAMRRLFELTVFEDRVFLISFGFILPVVFLLGVVGLFCRRPFAEYLAWFLLLGPGSMEWVHYIFPLLQNGAYRYFPGMWTAWLPMITGILGIRFLWQTRGIKHQ